MQNEPRLSPSETPCDLGGNTPSLMSRRREVTILLFTKVTKGQKEFMSCYRWDDLRRILSKVLGKRPGELREIND